MTVAAFNIDQAMARDARWESLLDAHFARGSWHVSFYLKSTENKKKQVQVCGDWHQKALLQLYPAKVEFETAPYNSFRWIIRFWVRWKIDMKDRLGKVKKQLKEYFTRANEIEYHMVEGESTNEHDTLRDESVYELSFVMKTFAYIVELAVGKAFFVDLASPKTIAPRTAKNGHSMNSCKGRKEPEATNCCLNTFPTLQSTHPLPITIATRTATHLHPKPKYGSEQFRRKNIVSTPSQHNNRIPSLFTNSTQPLPQPATGPLPQPTTPRTGPTQLAWFNLKLGTKKYYGKTVDSSLLSNSAAPSSTTTAPSTTTTKKQPNNNIQDTSMDSCKVEKYQL